MNNQNITNAILKIVGEMEPISPMALKALCVKAGVGDEFTVYAEMRWLLKSGYLRTTPNWDLKI